MRLDFIDSTARTTNFTTDVRAPGAIFLRSTPRPTNEQFKKHRYWSLCLPDLKNSYRSLCAYSCLPINTQGSVDHYLPKSAYPRHAYEWSNFRLCMDRINNYKGDSQLVLDPFVAKTDWFQLDLATLFVQPNPSLQKLVYDEWLLQSGCSSSTSMISLFSCVSMHTTLT